MSHSEALAYWQELEKKDPNVWIKTVLKAFGFSNEDFEFMKREQVFREEYHQRKGRELLELMRKKKRKREKELARERVLVIQELIKAMKWEGMSDEEINEGLAAVEDVRRNRCVIQDHGSPAVGSEDELRETG